MSHKKINLKEQKSIEVVNFDSTYNILQTKRSEIDIVFQNISYSVQVPDQTKQSFLPCKKAFKQKEILKNVSGIFKAGRCSAIMGASGAGKTTLLNILACRIDPTQGGKLYANNFQYTYETFGQFANYVMQSDVLMQTLTVRETLLFAARLKMDATQDQQRQKITKLANQLKLQKCLDTLVGGVILKGVSGGQRKRVSIAFELISDPQVIFLDQPTSGLDSLTSYIIVAELKKLAHQQNKTVIMTIHQPNSQIYQLFDDLTLLLQGRLIYQDAAQKITDYFQKNFSLKCPQLTNPPDYFMSKIHYENEKNRELYPAYFQAYKNNQLSMIEQKIEQKSTSQINLRIINNSFCNSLVPLVNRNWLNTIRNPMLLRSKVIQGIFIALFVGGLYFGVGHKDYTDKHAFQSVTGFLFFMTITGLMSFLSPVTLTFPSQRQVFFKEQDSKMYSIWQYFLARNITEIPQLLIIPLITISIYYFMIGLAPTGQQFFFHYFVYFLMGLNGSSMGLFLGSVILDEKSVSAMIPIVLLPFILFSGFFKNRADLPAWIGWIEYISPNKYAFIAYVNNETAYRDSNISSLNFDLGKWSAIGVLIGLGLFYRFASVFFLWLLKKKTQ